MFWVVFFPTGFLVHSTHRMALLYEHHLVEKTLPFRILLKVLWPFFFLLLESNPYTWAPIQLFNPMFPYRTCNNDKINEFQIFEKYTFTRSINGASINFCLHSQKDHSYPLHDPVEELGTALDLNEICSWFKKANICHIKVTFLAESIQYNSSALLSLHYMSSLPSLTFSWSYVQSSFSQSPPS